MKQNKIGQWVSWAVSFVISSKADNENSHDFLLYPGMRINTTKGPGVVTGGSLFVKLDRSPYPSDPNNRAWTFNLDKMQSKEVI